MSTIGPNQQSPNIPASDSNTGNTEPNSANKATAEYNSRSVRSENSQQPNLNTSHTTHKSKSKGLKHYCVKKFHKMKTHLLPWKHAQLSLKDWEAKLTSQLAMTDTQSKSMEFKSFARATHKIQHQLSKIEALSDNASKKKIESARLKLSTDYSIAEGYQEELAQRYPDKKNQIDLIVQDLMDQYPQAIPIDSNSQVPTDLPYPMDKAPSTVQKETAHYENFGEEAGVLPSLPVSTSQKPIDEYEKALADELAITEIQRDSAEFSLFAGSIQELKGQYEKIQTLKEKQKSNTGQQHLIIENMIQLETAHLNASCDSALQYAENLTAQYPDIKEQVMSLIQTLTDQGDTRL
ncbi:hypothetical protein CI610_00660 [invertebrate metagenome]|uniref:Uncharacterized protein n=1 Tax=invertebrate metagenome TaxID=1711999 RepID=A0A2H9TB05_9ZZZZ